MKNHIQKSINKVYDSELIAKLIRAIGFEDKLDLNVTQVQKLLFIVYGFYLAKLGYRIVNESPKAWPYGPVFPKTRKDEIHSKTYSIKDLEDEIEQEDIIIIQNIVKVFYKNSAKTLSNWSHNSDSPWSLTVNDLGEDHKWNVPINDDYIVDYFSKFFTPNAK